MTLQMQKINKSFGVNHVLNNVSLSLNSGEISALLGENGAGKSTLMNILGGVLPADSGEILLDNTPQAFQTPADSQSAGIAFIHQELSLINDLAIYENMFLGHEPTKRRGILDIDTMIVQTTEIFERMNVSLDPRIMVRDLDASYKQIVEISRAVLANAKIIIMDEPTTALTDPEIMRVFAIMKSLKRQGTGIVFISHKLEEVVTICDTYHILRNGTVVKKGDISDTDTARLAYHMVGHKVRTERLSRKENIGNEVLRLEQLSDISHYRNIDLSVRSGEILGVTGLLGDGRSELFQSVFGAHPYTQGKLFIEGKEVSIRDTPTALQLGIGYVPRDRKENGIVEDLNILENASIVIWPALAKHGVIEKKRQLEVFTTQRNNLNIRMESPTDSINSLSGGNQQKVVLAKWLSADPKLLILDNPTQGVDVGAKEEIYDIILSLAETGVAIVVLSSEAQEIVRLCDRSIVLFEGEIKGEVAGEKMSEHNIMRLATGSSLRKESDNS